MTEREGELKGGIVGGFGFRKLALHFTIEERGFDQAKTLHTPPGGDHLVHQILFDRRAGLISNGIIGQHFLDSRTMFFAVEFSREMLGFSPDAQQEMVRQRPLMGWCTLVMDGTGVGAPVDWSEAKCLFLKDISCSVVQYDQIAQSL